MAEQFWLVKRVFLALIFCGVLTIAHAQESTIDAPPQPQSLPATPPITAPPVPASAAQRSDDAKARSLLDAMVKALGGDKWLTLPGFQTYGRTASFYQGRPTGATAEFVAFHAYPDKDRTVLGKKHDVVEILIGNEGWEVTYKGKTPIPQKEVEDALRRRSHSIEIAIRSWLKDPATLLVNGGQATVERHLVDRVTLISSTNDNITIELDAQTHLPVRRTFEWRDPLYKDQNVDADEYDNYHEVSGIQTPFNITRFHNDDMVNQRFLYNVTYAGPVPAVLFDPNQDLAKLDKKDAKKEAKP